MYFARLMAEIRGTRNVISTTRTPTPAFGTLSPMADRDFLQGGFCHKCRIVSSRFETTADISVQSDMLSTPPSFASKEHERILNTSNYLGNTQGSKTRFFWIDGIVHPLPLDRLSSTPRID